LENCGECSVICSVASKILFRYLKEKFRRENVLNRKLATGNCMMMIMMMMMMIIIIIIINNEGVVVDFDI